MNKTPKSHASRETSDACGGGVLGMGKMREGGWEVHTCRCKMSKSWVQMQYGDDSR